MTGLKKTEVLELLGEKLRAGGVKSSAIPGAAEDLWSALQSGETLRLADLGVLHLDDDGVSVSPLPSAVPLVVSAWRASSVAHDAPVFTVSTEASIRRLMRSGYSRPDAEVALMTAGAARTAVR